MLGTFVEISVPIEHAAAIDAAFGVVAHVHARMSFHDERSDLAALRRAAPGTSVSVDRETVTVLRFAQDLRVRSAGLFDVGIGQAMIERGFLPTFGFDASCFAGNGADIEVVSDTHVRCHRPVLIDLGGIAKGHAVDCAAAVLINAGVGSAIVNAGGDLRVIGDIPQIVYLRSADGIMDATISVADTALASSAFVDVQPGGATPYVGPDGRCIPANDAVTIAADRCMTADAMTKIALADPELAAAMLAELGGEIVTRPSRRLAA